MLRFFRKIQPKKLFISLVIGLVLLALSKNYFLHEGHSRKYAQITVEALGTHNDSAKSSEVWILGVKNGQQAISTSSLPLTSDWEQRDQSILSYQHQPSRLNIKIEAPDTPSIRFLMHPWSGRIRISDGKQAQAVDLYSGGSGEYIYRPQTVYTDASPMFAVKQIAGTALVFLLIMALSYVLLLAIDKGSYYPYLASLALFAFVFLFQTYIVWSTAAKIILLLATLGATYLSLKLIKSQLGRRLVTRRNLFVFALITVISGFCFEGCNLFLNPSTEGISLGKLAYLLAFSGWFALIELSFLYITQYISLQVYKDQSAEKRSVLKVWLGFFAFLAAGWGVYLAILFPGNMSGDSLDQWRQAIGTSALSDWHPYTHTLFNRLLIGLYPSPFSVSLFQLLFLAGVCASFFGFLYKRQIPIAWLAVMAVLLVVLPAQGMMVSTLWKDVPFCTAILWLTLLVAELITDTYLINKRTTLVLLVFAFLAVSLFRHNGLFVSVATMMALAIYAWKQKNKQIPVAMGVAVAAMISCTFILSKTEKIIPNPDGIKYVAPLHGVAAVVREGDTLDAATAQTMKKVLPMADWVRLYDAYTPNTYLFYSNQPFVNNISSLSTGEVLGAYTRTLYHHPFEVVRDRLLGTELLWSVGSAENAFNYRYTTGIDSNELALHQEPNNAKPYLEKYLNETVELADVVAWRVGLFNVLILLTWFLMTVKGQGKSWYVFIPWLFSNISLMLSMAHQDYRYVYYVALLFPFLWLLALSGARKRAGNSFVVEREKKLLKVLS